MKRLCVMFGLILKNVVIKTFKWLVNTIATCVVSCLIMIVLMGIPSVLVGGIIYLTGLCPDAWVVTNYLEVGFLSSVILGMIGFGIHYSVLCVGVIIQDAKRETDKIIKPKEML